MKFNDLLQLIESEENLRHEILYHYDGLNKKKRAEGWFNSKNQLHRLDGPAKINYYPSGKISTEFWCKDGKRHRIGGPALLDYDWDEECTPQLWEFWINGVNYTPKEYEEYMKKIEDLSADEIDMLGDLGQTFD